MPDYALGYTEAEFSRLERQGEFLAGITSKALAEAGLREGMNVLDVGCGAGDVSFAASDIVGPTGTVRGIDRNPETVAKARARAARQGRTNCTFSHADISRELPAGPFDAVVGRLVLMYHPEPVEVVRHLSRLVVPNGIVFFQEIDLASARSHPPVPVADDAVSLLVSAFRAGGADPAMGLALDRTFRDAGLQPSLSASFRMDGHGEGFCPAWISGTMGSLLDLVEAHGLGDRSDLEPGPLEERIRSALAGSRAVMMGPPLVSAWARVS